MKQESFSDKIDKKLKITWNTSVSEILSRFWEDNEAEILNYSFKLSILLVLIAILLVLFPATTSFRSFNLKKGDVAQEDIIAEMRFEILKSHSELEKERTAAENSVPPVFILNPNASTESLQKLKSFLDEINYADQKISLPDTSKKQNDELLKAELRRKKIDFLKASNLSLPIRDESTLSILLDKRNRQIIERRVNLALSKINNKGLLSIESKDTEWGNQRISFIVVVEKSKSDTDKTSPSKETLLQLDRVLDRKEASEIIKDMGSEYFVDNEDMRNAFFQIATGVMIPHYIYDRNETERLKKLKRDEVPLTKGFVEKNEIIVSAHRQITDEVLDKLNSYEIARKKLYASDKTPKWTLYSPIVSRALFCAIIIFILISYLYVHCPKNFYNNSSLLVLSILILIVMVSVYFIKGNKSLEYIIPISFGSMLATIIFDAKMGVIITVVISMMVGGLAEFGFSGMFVTFIGGICGVYSTRSVRHRHQFYSSMFYVSLGYIIAISSIDMSRVVPIKTILENYLYGISNGVLSSILVIGILPIFESVFKITTDVKLLELSDLNRPLLQKLSIEAPGTYNHSIIVGSLASSAAEAINANSILARVGAYYHDIGKMKMPEYFIENQFDGVNRHDDLSPNMSVLIVRSHIKEGIELAKEYKLPQAVIDFIPQHHGTDIIQYFYKKAMDKDSTVATRDYDFRYEGPKPQTKESAIVMLADGVESATRSLQNPTPHKIREVVKSIIDRKYYDGELDECDITLKDLTAIENSFVRTLTGIFHRRISYPSRENSTTNANSTK